MSSCESIDGGEVVSKGVEVSREMRRLIGGQSLTNVRTPDLEESRVGSETDVADVDESLLLNRTDLKEVED